MDELLKWLSELSLTVKIIIQITAFITVLLIAWGANTITKSFILGIIEALIKRTKSKWDDALLENRVFQLLSHIIPAVILYLTAPFIFFEIPAAAGFMQQAAVIYMILVGLLVVNGFLNAVVDIYRTFEFANKIPIRGFMQVIKIVLFLLGGIVVLSLIVDKDPSKLLAGMGAMTAVLMLIFKDAILGFVAGIQLSANNMVHIGDWIEMPKYGADGDVIDVSLTTVKVQNWDKTISTIPAYSLISDSFKNWRGMSESSGRRIKRSINIDMNAIRFCDEAMLNKFRNIRYIAEYIDSKKREIDEHNRASNVDDSDLVNGRRMTNIGTFRAYIIAYLKNNPKINQNMTFLVRQLQPGPEGLPIEIYVFSADQAWANYEAIQADIFDHILAVVPEFGLRVYQNPTGADFSRLVTPSS